MTKSDVLRMPRQEDCVEMQIGNRHFLAIRVTSENQRYLADVLLSSYIGHTCPFCLRVMESVEDLRDRQAVFYHRTEYGSVACLDCFKKYGTDE